MQYRRNTQPFMLPYHEEGRLIESRKQKRHQFEFMSKYEGPSNFLFRQDRTSSIRVSQPKNNLDRMMTPAGSVRMPSFVNRKNLSLSIHEIFSKSQTLKPIQQFKIRHRNQVDHQVVYKIYDNFGKQ